MASVLNPQGLILAALFFLAAAIANQALTLGATYMGEDVGWRQIQLVHAPASGVQ